MGIWAIFGTLRMQSHGAAMVHFRPEQFPRRMKITRRWPWHNATKYAFSGGDLRQNVGPPWGYPRIFLRDFDPLLQNSPKCSILALKMASIL